ncbi:MAG: TonB-dependent receptor [Bacteroidota bacterium]
MKKLYSGKSIFLAIISVFISLVTFAQGNTFTGTVLDANNKEALFGVTVVEKGTNNAVTTDLNGKFTITPVHDFPVILQLSFSGYLAKELELYSAEELTLSVSLQPKITSDEVVITARRRKESPQQVPIPVSVVSGALIEQSGSFNVNRVKELVPSVQLYSSNPRNTALNIRGLGSPFGLTNDGIEPGVGFYVDGVYYARPAATTLDFIDIEQIEVLRGPQGTLFGKNTTAGAFNITTRKASFTPGASFESSYGNYGYVQTKASVTGPLSDKFAARVSVSGTQRDGTIENVVTQQYINDINNLGGKAQLLFKPNDNVEITLSADATRQRPNGYAQVVAGVVQTKRAGYRQFDSIASSLNYSLPSTNPYDRKVDQNTTWRSNNDLGGASLNADFKIGKGTLTSTSAWRYWNWDPSNDRDFTGLSVLQLSQAPSKHQQWSQELRYSGDFTSRLSGTVGLFAIGQELKSDPYHTEESGNAQWRFSQSSTSALWATPGLFEGYGIRTTSQLNSQSAAAFGQLDYNPFDKFHVLAGIRYNYDAKQVDYNRVAYGGLQTTNPALIALKKQVYSDQAFKEKTSNNNVSYVLTLAYKASNRFNTYATYSTNYKSVGLNLGGLPTASGATLTELAVIKPEYTTHVEVGVKTKPTENSVLNVTAFNTDIKDYQTQVQTAEVGVNRGYLANAEKVRVRGLELDGSIRAAQYLSFYGNLAYTEGIYVSFVNAPVPLEETGSANAFKDISGGSLPGISKWSASTGAELSTAGKFLNQEGRYFVAGDVYYRSTFSSSASPSQYLNINGYSIVNGRIGFRVSDGLSVSLWGRNLFNTNYLEQLLPAAGNSGLYAAVVGDPRTYGITVKYAITDLRKK